MKNLRPVFWTTAAVSILVLHASARAAESPLGAVRSTIERATAVLQDPAYQGKEKRPQRVGKVRDIILPRFDAQEMAKRALGTHWRTRTEDERKKFVQLFIVLVETTYSQTLDRYNRGMQFFFDHERIEGDFAEVDTRIVDPAQNKTFVVNYRLHKIGETWLVYDVVAENISLVRNYRTQFHRILSESPYSELVRKIEGKVKELDIVSAQVPGASS